MLDQDLSIGPFNVSLADLGWSDDITSALDSLNDALLGLFVVYLISIIATGLSLCAGIAALALYKQPLTSRDELVNARWSKANSFLASLGATALFTGSIVVTVAADKAIKKFNRYGDDIGVSAEKGSKFRALSWSAFAFVLAAAVYWCLHKYLLKRERRNQWTERKASDSGRGDSHEMSGRAGLDAME